MQSRPASRSSTRRHVLVGCQRGDHRPAARHACSPAATTTCWRPRCTTPPDQDERPGALTQAHPLRDRRLATPARHRLHRPLPGAPLGHRHVGGRNRAGTRRSRPHRQGALHRRLGDVRLAVSPSSNTAPLPTDGAFVSMQTATTLSPARTSGSCSRCVSTWASVPLPYSPLAKDYSPGPGTALAAGAPRAAPRPRSRTGPRTSTCQDAVRDLAQGHGIPPAQVALDGCCGNQPSAHRSLAPPGRPHPRRNGRHRK